MDVTNFPGLTEYLEYIKADYAKRKSDSPYRDEFIERFNVSLQIEVGSKYIKVIAERFVHSFICLKDNGKFVKGDILKADSYTSPARNFARGNIISRKYDQVSWTGA
jgi:hypothetical protein